jgi:GNAT superfamily N-acetyltransferase
VIKPVAADDLAAVADLLVRAFDDDPLSTFIFGGDRRRRWGLHSFFTAQIRHQYLPLGQVFTTQELGGVAVWAPPSRQRHPVKELVEMLPTVPFLVGKNMGRALRLLGEIDALHPREPHWYLATLGTDPRFQGTGVGSALLSSMLARVDEEGMPAYLESSKARNVPLYARYGFEVIEEFHSKVGSPPMWRMWREPRLPEP